MIVRKLAGNRLLSLNQTTHALLAAALCRRWGNGDFARPEPYDAVLTGVAQHDNGWFEWESAPQVDGDGRPADFLHAPAAVDKLALWQRGIRRVLAQHPYAGLLVSRHAVRLYGSGWRSLPEGEERAATERFLAEQEALLARLRAEWRTVPGWAAHLHEDALAANVALLRFGDNASLCLCMPWENDTVLEQCPVDRQGAFIDLRLHWEEGLVAIDPWPFAVAEFTIAAHGRLLDRETFADHEELRAALAAAPLHELRWRVAPAH